MAFRVDKFGSGVKDIVKIIDGSYSTNLLKLANTHEVVWLSLD